MKSTLFFLATGALVVGLTAFGQETNQSDPQTQGRGRGGAPYAWGDANGDGICDLTGDPVGQGRGQGMSPGWRGQQGQGMGRGMGRGIWQGMYCPRGQNTPPAAPSAQPDPSPAK
jgi:hypothetical protein